MSTPTTQQRIVHYQGHVQGVGFRQTTTLLARPYRVVGYVQNLEDGRVKLVMEGSCEEMDQLERDIDERLGEFIRGRKVETRPATGQFERFEVKR